MQRFFYSIYTDKPVINGMIFNVRNEDDSKQYIFKKPDTNNQDINAFIFNKLKACGENMKENEFELINSDTPTIKVKYHNKDLTKISISKNGNFVDLRSAEKVSIKAGEFKLIDLGVSIKLPEGYWGQIVPRSSLFKNHGLIQTNSFGVVDTTYCGEEDHWKMPVYATRDTDIDFDERICQFRIVKDNNFVIDEVDHMEDNSRGGFGSTGRL